MQDRWRIGGGPALVLASITVFMAVSGCSSSSSDDGTSSTSTTSTSKAHPLDGVVVYEAGPDGERQLYAMDIPSGDVLPVKASAQGVGPRLSPDGRKVAFSVPGQNGTSSVTVVGIAAGKAEELGDGGCPTWTTEGEAVLAKTPKGVERLGLDGSRQVVMPGDDRCALQIEESMVLWDQSEDISIARDGTKPTKWLSMPRCGLGPVAADPKGDRIAFTAACEDESHSGLYVADLNDPHPKRILNGNAYGATWSPTGDAVATAVICTSPDLGECRLEAVSPDGSWTEPIRGGGPINAPTWGPPTPDAKG